MSEIKIRPFVLMARQFNLSTKLKEFIDENIKQYLENNNFDYIDDEPDFDDSVDLKKTLIDDIVHIFVSYVESTNNSSECNLIMYTRVPNLEHNPNDPYDDGPWIPGPNEYEIDDVVDINDLMLLSVMLSKIKPSRHLSPRIRI